MKKSLLLFLITLTGLASSAQTTVISSPVTSATVGALYTSPVTAITNSNKPITLTSVGTMPSFLNLSIPVESSGKKISGSTPNVGAVAHDPATGNFYAVQNSGTNIYKITPDGTTTVFAQKTSGRLTYGGALVLGDFLYVTSYTAADGGGLAKYDLRQSQPAAVELINNLDLLSITHKDGFIYGANYTNGRIIKYNIATNTKSDLISVPPTGPFGLGFNNAGDLYIAYYSLKELWKYSPGTSTGGTLTKINVILTASPSDVKVDAEDNVYVSFFGLPIRRYTPDFSSFTVVSGSVVNRVWGMSLSSSGVLSYGDVSGGAVYSLQTGATISGTPAIADIGTYPITVRATDGVTSDEKTYTLSVFGPSTINFQDISQRLADGSFNLTDPISNSGGAFTYTSSNSAVATISGNRVILIGEGTSTITVSQAANGLYLQTTKTSTLTVRNVALNSEPTDLSLSGSAINENNAVTASIGNLSSTDADAGDVHNYTLVSGTGSADNGSFTIAGDQLKSGISFDFETKNSYSVRVRSTDAGGLSFEKALTVTVNNINELPTDLSLSGSAINENNAVTASIGNLSSTDADAGDVHVYTLVSGTGSADNGSFTIAGNQLRSAISFDFETKGSYSVRVRSTDAGGLSFEKDLTVTVNNINEMPTAISLSASAINENNAVTASIGNLSTTDSDAGDVHIYTLVSGTGSADNGSFTISGNQLRSAISFDFETKDSYSVRVRSTDAGGLSFEKDLTIKVNNINEAPTNIALSKANLYENNAVGATIGNLSSIDQDAGGTFSYSLVSGDVSAFTIIGNQLYAKTTFNFASKNSYNVRISTTDIGGLSFEKVFTVTISELPILTGTGNEFATKLQSTASLRPKISKGFSSNLNVSGSDIVSYNWSPSTSLNSTITSSPIAKPAQSQIYSVTVMNRFGSSTTLSITVEVMEDYNIVANNILTPNGDGQNDLWVIENLSSYPINSLLIFDRTGRVIHSKINYANDWDGQNNGNFLPEDTYYYVITFDNGAIKKMGFITIIK